LESVNRRLDTVRIEAMEAETPISMDDDDEVEEDVDGYKDDLGPRVAYLEKMMAEKQREMKRIQLRMTDLSADVTKQIEGMMNKFSTFVLSTELELGVKSSSSSAHVNQKYSECIVYS